MRRHSLLFVLLTSIAALGVTSNVSGQQLYQTWVEKADPDYKWASPKAYEAWKDRKFGMRIHWGIYSTLGVDASWPLIREDDSWKKLYLTQYQVFNPTDFNADQWAKDAERWGFKYFVFTTKHHDGFSMYDTDTKTQAYRRKLGAHWPMSVTQSIEMATMNFSIRDTMFKRDIVRELVDAFRGRGLGVGLYFSHIDWNDPNFRWDPNNVHYRKDQKYSKETNPKEWQAFTQREKDQVRELCTKYGPIQQIDFDAGWPKEAHPEIVEIIKMARKLQPDALFRNRGVGVYGDFSTPEHWTPTSPDDKRIKSNNAWQTIEQIETDWAWTPNGVYKPKEWILDTLIDSASMGGNFMVGVSPMPNGQFPPETVSRLEWTGKWLKVNGEAIYATRPLSVEKASKELKDAYQVDRKSGIRYTRSKDGKSVYAIVKGWPGKSVMLRTVRPAEGGKIVMLGAPEELTYTANGNAMVVALPEKYQVEANRPCEFAVVLKIPVAEGAFGKGG